MGKEAVLVFIFALFGFFIILAFSVSQDQSPVDTKKDPVIINNTSDGIENKESAVSAPKIIIAKQEEEKTVIEDTAKDNDVVEPQIIKIEVPVFLPPQANPPVEEITNEPINNMPEEIITLEIISPISGKGLGREYLARESVKDEYNYIEIALIVWQGEEAKKDSLVRIVATDSIQNKELNSTGYIATIYKDGQKLKVPAYFFHYEFKEAGNQSITFFAEGKELTTPTLVVGVDERE